MNNMLILGILLSIIFYEITDLSPGGIIIPAYLSMYLDNPKKVIYTLLISLLVLLTVKLLSNYIILYGKRQFVLCILTSFILEFFFQKCNLYLIETQDIYLFNSGMIGVLVTGILSQDMMRQGIFKTLSSLVILSIFIKALVEIYYSIGGII